MTEADKRRIMAAKTDALRRCARTTRKHGVTNEEIRRIMNVQETIHDYIEQG